MIEHHLTQRRQAQAVVNAVKQRRPQLGFEVENLPVDRRGRHMQIFRRLADGTAADHFIEIAQNSGVHAHRLHGFGLLQTHPQVQSALTQTVHLGVQVLGPDASITPLRGFRFAVMHYSHQLI